MLKYQRIALLTLSLAGLAAAASARDYGQYSDVSPAIRSWINSLTGYQGLRCCAMADGIEPDDWEMQKGHYRVKVYGEWLNVPNTAVVRSANRLGRAVVWIDDGEGDLWVRCFLPGPQS